MLLRAALLAIALEPSYAQAQAELESAIAEAQSGDAKLALERLEQALAQLEDFALELADDESGLARRDLALLALAYTHYALDEMDEAKAAMDEAIRGAGARALPVRRFGPDFQALYAERLTTLSELGRAKIQVNCNNCTVLINEQHSTPVSDSLLLGRYRVFVHEDGLVYRDQIELQQAGQTYEVVVPKPALADPPKPIGPRPGEAPEKAANTAKDGWKPKSTTRPDRGNSQRMLPRWAGITGAAAGAALLIIGGVIFAFDERCPNGEDPLSPTGCPEVYDAKPAGYSLMAIGAGVGVGFGVVLTLDELKASRAVGRQAMIRYTFKF